MAGLARRLAPAAALGGLAVLIVGVADPALAGRTTSTDTGAQPVAAEAGAAASDAPAGAASKRMADRRARRSIAALLRSTMPRVAALGSGR